MKRHRLVALVIATMSLAGCNRVAWTGKYMAAPGKRGHASEERAVQALDQYFIAAKDVVALSHVHIHDDCLNAYWEKGPSTYQRNQRIRSDKVCALVVNRFDDAAGNLAGYGQSPSGKYPWLGEVFEYVLRTQTVQTKEEKIANLDRYVIKKFESLMSGESSPVIPLVAKDYYVIRGTCCREVTVFDDWYKTRFERASMK